MALRSNIILIVIWFARIALLRNSLLCMRDCSARTGTTSMIILNCGPTLTQRQRWLLRATPERMEEPYRIYNLRNYGFVLGVSQSELAAILNRLPCSSASWRAHDIIVRTYGDVRDLVYQVRDFSALLPALYGFAVPLLVHSTGDELRIIYIRERVRK